MSFMKRDSLSAIGGILLGTYNQGGNDDLNSDGPIGKVISRPTKSIFIRHGTKEQQVLQLETELRHAHMQLSAERARVQEMETTLKRMINEKFTNTSNIITKLQDSQNALRDQLQMVIQSKLDLCEETAKEIDRLRTVIRRGKFSAYVPVSSNTNNNYNRHNNHSNIHHNGSEEEKDRTTMDISDFDKNNDPFPHGDASRIDLRSLSAGDNKTLPNPFASVDLQYTGYIVDSKNPRDRNKWNRFIDESTSKTIFETKLGNNENIIGLEQAVLSMSLGERAIVWVPSRLGYGTHGAPNLIPPNADIVFELTLVSIQNDNEMVSNNGDGSSVDFDEDVDDIDDDDEDEDDDINGNNMNHNNNNDDGQDGYNNDMNDLDDETDVLFGD